MFSFAAIFLFSIVEFFYHFLLHLPFLWQYHIFAYIIHTHGKTNSNSIEKYLVKINCIISIVSFPAPFRKVASIISCRDALYTYIEKYTCLPFHISGGKLYMLLYTSLFFPLDNLFLRPFHSATKRCVPLSVQCLMFHYMHVLLLMNIWVVPNLCQH